LTLSFGSIIPKSIEYSTNGTKFATFSRLKQVRFGLDFVPFLTVLLANLNPFWQTQTAYWQSPGVKVVNILNYLYTVAPATGPVTLPPVKIPLPQRFVQASNSISAFVANSAAEPAAALGEISQQLGVSLPANKISADAEARQDILAVPVERGLADWRVRVSVKKYEVGGSFSVYIFFGDVPADSNQWYFDKSLVGTFDVFSNDTPEKCDNCVDQRDKAIVGYVHISRAILERSHEGSLHKSVVLPQLEKLRWSVKKVRYGLYFPKILKK
jgi:tyrosinase